MLRNFIMLTIRQLFKNKLYTMLKLFGLALAFSVGIAIFTWIRFETSYDTFHKDAKDIYRIFIGDNEESGNVSVSPAVKTQILDNIPDIHQSVRLFKSGFIGKKTKVTANDKVFTNDDIYYADDNFFKVFSFPLIHGNTSDAFKNPNSIVITKNTANKYFGVDDPIGGRITFSDNKEFFVTGVLQDLPPNSHFHFDMLVSLKDHTWDIEKIGLGSGWVFPTYIKIDPKSSQENVTKKLVEFTNYMKSEFPGSPEYNFILQPLTSIHLHSHSDLELEPNGDIRYIYLFITIGMLVIIVASINYINLTTVNLSTRAKEIGIRKVLGASQKQLLKQFVGESIILSLLALVLAVCFLTIIKPLLSSFANPAIFSELFGGHTITFVGILTLFLGTITGILPGMVFNQSNPASIFRSGIVKSLKSKNVGVRNILVIVQFCISTILVISTIVIYQQMQFIQNKNLGYNKDHVLVLNIGYDGFYKKIDLFKNEIAKHPAIQHATATSQLPTNIITPENVDARDDKVLKSFYMSVDKDFFTTMDVEILEGKDRIENFAIDHNQNHRTIRNKFVVNEQFLNQLGFEKENAVAEEISIRHGNMQKGQIIGVIKDFHFHSLHNPIEPLVLEFVPWDYQYLLIKFNSQNVPQTIKFIEKQWQQLAGNMPFTFTFLDENYNKLYKAEEQTGKLFLVFTVVSVFIIILGVFGLSAFTTARRTKEIGVRKVLGASIQEILGMLLRGYTYWTLFANIIAWPIAWYAMNKWLQNFAYRIDLTIWPFLLAGLAALVIALLAVSWQAIRAATANPVEALRYE